MAIVFNSVSFCSNKIKILDGINFSIEEGSITGIYGKNGSGKSTIAKILSNIVLPNSGNVLSLNHVIDNKSKNNMKYKKRIGYVPQYMDNWFCCDIVYDEMNFILRNHRISPNKIDEKIKNVCFDLGFDEKFLSKKIECLEFWEKRMLLIACAIFTDPDLIIIDEPTTGLDANNRKSVISNIKRLKDDYKKTIVVISSDIDILIKYVDNLIIVDSGKCICSGKKMDVIKNTEFFKKYDLNMPRIINFSEIVKEEKNKKIGYYDDVKDLMKAVYRNV